MMIFSEKRRKEHTLRIDAYDVALSDRVVESPVAKEVLENAPDIPQAPRLFQDLFLSLFKVLPRLKSPEDIAPAFQVNLAIMARAMEERAWEELRLRTKLDEALGLLGAVSLAEEFLKLLAREQEKLQKVKELEDRAYAQEAFAEALMEAGLEEEAQEALQAAAQARQEASALVQQALQALETIPRAALRKALRQAGAKVEEAAQALAGWGIEPGQESRVPPEERLALAQAILSSQKLRKIAELAGRLKNVALAAQAEKVEKAAAEVYGIEQGRDLSRVLPQELAFLRHPILRKDFRRRFTEGQLLQYHLRERERLAMGPLVVCWDESGSMAGEKEIWAKAVSLALLFIAQKQRRPWAGIAFSNSTQVKTIVVPSPHKEVDGKKLADLASHFFGGGTDFVRPLEEARRIIGEEKRFERADIVFITDGIAPVPETFAQEFLAWKAKVGVRLFAVLIDVDAHSAESLQPIADRIERVVGFAQDIRGRETVAKAVFGGV